MQKDDSVHARRRAIVAGGAIATAALAAALVPFGHHPRLAVTTEPLTSGSIVRRIVTTGTVMPVSSVDVGTQVSGTVESILVDYNSVVHRGQVLLRLDSGSARAVLEQARATLGRTEADLAQVKTAEEDAQQKMQRADDLATRALIPDADLDAARTAVAQADADVASAEGAVAQARAAVREASVDLAQTVIRSPVDGVVIDRAVDVGVTVAAIQSPVLLRLATDFRHMEVQASVDESDIGELRPGESASFQVSAYPDETFRGTVSTIRLDAVREAPTADPSRPAVPAPASATAVVSYPVIITVENANEELRPGMTATVSFEGLRRDHAVRLPNQALSFTPSPQVLTASHVTKTVPSPVEAFATHVARVWEYNGSDFTPVTVETGLSDDRWTELVKGPIGPGMPVVTHAAIER